MSEEYRVEISKTVSVVAPDEESAVKNAVSQTKRDVVRNAPGYFIDSFNFTVVGAPGYVSGRLREVHGRRRGQ